MFKTIKQLFAIEKHPRKGLMPVEWVMVAYLLLTLCVIFFCYTKVNNPEAMIWGRVRIAVITVALWAVYRMIPCRLTLFARIVVQFALLSWWYPDTFELNRMLPNLDHVVAAWEQNLFGCQPALLFSRALPWPFFSEIMDLGYVSYFPMIVVVMVFYFLFRYHELERVAFVALASFFIYYVVFILMPVAGPTFYYKAVGLGDITRGVFPDIHDYFTHYQDCFPAPGYKDGLFYNLVEDAKAAGERPTAAFPSSHVGVSTVLMFLALHTGQRKLLYCLLPFYVLLCLSTVYIQAHYAVDALAGLASGALLYFVLMWAARGMKK